MKNYSRQREAILQVLKEDSTHPTAQSVYEAVKKKIPNISLGTIYRNLAALSKSGEILGISVGDGFEHFDADTSAHIHLHCRSCGSTVDLPIAKDPISGLAEQSGFKPDTSVFIVYGECSDCNGKN